MDVTLLAFPRFRMDGTLGKQKAPARRTATDRADGRLPPTASPPTLSQTAFQNTDVLERCLYVGGRRAADPFSFFCFFSRPTTVVFYRRRPPPTFFFICFFVFFQGRRRAFFPVGGRRRRSFLLLTPRFLYT